VGAADHSSDPDHPHQSRDLVTAQAQARAAGGVPELAPPVDATIRTMQVPQHVGAVGVVEIRRGDPLMDGGVVGAQGDRDAMLGEHGADQRDPEAVAVGVDVVDDHRSRRSSSAWAKNALAVFKI
jgi:hypothetical protein